MASAARRSRLILASEVVVGLLAATVLAAGCGGSASHLAWDPAKPSALLSSAPGVRDKPALAVTARAPGVAGRWPDHRTGRLPSRPTQTGAL